MTDRQENNGVRKVCRCARKHWEDEKKCGHPWHFNYKPKKSEHCYRFSLDKYLDTHIVSKDEALVEAAKIRIAIKAGTFHQLAPVRDSLTLSQLLDLYDTRYLQKARPSSAKNLKYQTGKIASTVLAFPTGGTKAFGTWKITDITTDTIETFREVRQAAGMQTTNRDLSLLRAMFSWAVRLGYLEATPFKRGTETVIKLKREKPRSRRLQNDEGDRLLAACGPRVRALMEGALETGMRRGELLNLRWRDIEGMTIETSKNNKKPPTITWSPRAELLLRETKTDRPRNVPISTRLRTILEMRRFDPAGKPLAADKHVFGDEIGTRQASFRRAWHHAILKAHGHKPTYTKSASLTTESRAVLKKIGLHFHDLRREAGSRWMEAGVPLATIQKWLGHTNIAQTSTYLATTTVGEHEAMKRFEEQRAALQRIATDVETAQSERARAGTTRSRKRSNRASEHQPRIM